MPLFDRNAIRGKIAILCAAVCLWFGTQPMTVLADEAAVDLASRADSHSSWASPIGLLQKFISRADGDRCPMYPTCSHYARQAFAKEGVLKGWILTSDRLLRCGRDETRLADPVRVQGVIHAYDPLEANTFWWKKR